MRWLNSLYLFRRLKKRSISIKNMCKHHYQGSTPGNAACCMDTADCPQMTLMKSDKKGKKERRGYLLVT